MIIFLSFPAESTSLSDIYKNQDIWDELSSRNIHLTSNEHNADATMIVSTDVANSEADNLIVLEKVDGCQIISKKIVSEPRVLKLVKLSHYSDLSVCSLPNCDNRVFTRHLTTEYNKREESLPPEIPVKLCLGLSFLHYHRHFAHMESAANRDLQQNRTTDIFFAGTTQYGPEVGNSRSGSLITSHRKTLVDRLRGLSFGNRIVEPNRAFRGREYIDLLNDSKLTISPWGWGESCYRDFEALLHGCEVIKPATYKMVSNPDIYNDKYMTFCKPDWSDLDTVIQERLDTWHLRAEQREENKHFILDKMSIRSRADIVENILLGTQKNCLDRAA